MNLLGISGSVRSGSYNLAYLKAMQELQPKGTTLSIYDQINEIPVFDPGLSEKELPDSACSLISMIRDSDGLIISTPVTDELTKRAIEFSFMAMEQAVKNA